MVSFIEEKNLEHCSDFFLLTDCYWCGLQGLWRCGLALLQQDIPAEESGQAITALGPQGHSL